MSIFVPGQKEELANMTILEIEKDLSLLMRIIINFMTKENDYDIEDIALFGGYSTSYMYKLRNEKTKKYAKAKRIFIANILDSIGLKIVKNHMGDYEVLEGIDHSFYMYGHDAYIFDKDSKVLSKGVLYISMVDDKIKIKVDDTNLMAGTYDSVDLVTRGSLEHVDYNEYYDPSKNSIEIVINGLISDKIEQPLFGFFFRKSAIHRMSTGRMVILKDIDKEIVSNDILFFLENERFHEFYQYDLFINDTQELAYLVSQFQQKYKFVNLELPKELATAYQHFLSFFAEYVGTIKGKEIKFDVSKSVSGLAVNIEILSKEVQMDEVENWLKEYISFAKKQNGVLQLNVESDISRNEVDIFIVHLKNQIAHLEGEINILTLKNSFLLEKNAKSDTYIEYLQKVVNDLSVRNLTNYNFIVSGGEQNFTDKLEKKEMKIRNQNIYGGSQQFADSITNYNNISENDRNIIELVAKDNSNIDRNKLAESLQTIKSSDATEEAKNKSKGFLQTIFNATLSEATKLAVKTVFSQAGEYVELQDIFN